MKKIIVTLFILLISVGAFCFFSSKKDEEIQKKALQYKKYYEEAFTFCQNKQINTDFFILVDFSIHSGKKRMFLYDFEKDSITDQFLVSHGCGQSPTGLDFSREKPLFSNEPNSHLSSLGKYLIGKNKVKSPNYGQKYLLYGQDETNNNALKRDVVLHPWSIVPDFEPYPRGVPESWGCPAVSASVFEKLDQKLQTSTKNTLLWIVFSEKEVVD